MSFKIRYFFLLFICLNSTVSYPQLKLIKSNAADHSKAIEINDSIVGPYTVSNGYGRELEFRFDSGVREENSIWFKFAVLMDTLLTFDIVPLDSTEDYDFILFKCSSNDQFDSIRNRKKIPERVCFSFNSSKSSSTGLSEFTNKKIIGGGPGPSYVGALAVKQGETYYLMVTLSEVYRKTNPKNFAKGFMIYFYDYWPRKKPVILKNVLFENNKNILLPASYVELDKLVNMLKQNTFLNIEIRGYTDNIGKEKNNKILSEQRAKAVCDYLISKSISSKRLLYKGFGSDHPIASNQTPEGREQNRRVEFAIIMK